MVPICFKLHHQQAVTNKVDFQFEILLQRTATKSLLLSEGKPFVLSVCTCAKQWNVAGRSLLIAPFCQYDQTNPHLLLGSREKSCILGNMASA